jgi:predicted MPP superfamily phosphohydrolase
MLTRRAMLGALAGLVPTAASASAYGFWIEPAWRLAVAEYRMTPANWPAGRTLTIAALSDLHAGEPYMPLERVHEIVQATNALRPDLVVLLGDLPAVGRFVTRAIPAAETIAVLRGLEAPVHSVLGNHDWWDDPDTQRLRGGLPRIAGLLDDAGFAMLHNRAVKVGGVWVAGLGSLWAFRVGRRFIGADNLDATLGAVTDADPVILLCHEPDAFPRVPPGRVALTMSGHTHGGQVRLLGYSPIVPSAYGNRYAYGHVAEGGKDLIVSGGLGITTLPVRFGVPPEITLVRLGAAEG